MEKNGAIVYYSWIGNTKIIAEEIQRLIDYDIVRIEEKKERQLGHIMGPALSALLGLKSSVKPMDFDLQNYEKVFIGAPVWAGKTTPAINKFLSKADFKGKEVWVFITKADVNVPQKVIDSITSRIEKKGGKVMDSFSVTTKWDPKTNIPMAAEELSGYIRDWIEKIDLK